MLIAGGLILAKDKIPPASAITEKLLPMAGTIGFAAIGIGIIDLLLDIVTLRPIVGDGIAQLAALASGGVLAKQKLDDMFDVGALKNLLNALKDNQIMLGFATLSLGIIHLFLGNITLI